MPAYNAEKTLKKTYFKIPKEYRKNIILTDDYSSDRTIEIAKKIGIKIIQHKKNKGYGANQKTCFNAALKEGADIIVMLHPDYQYDPKKIPEMIEPIKKGEADVVYGSRMLIRGSAKKGGMPFYKRIGNFILTTYMNFMLGTKITDSATGYIAYSSKVLKKIYYKYNHDGFCFDEETMIQIAESKSRITEIPIPVRYEEISSSISLKKSIKYGITLFFKMLQYKLHQSGIWRFKKFNMKGKV